VRIPVESYGAVPLFTGLQPPEIAKILEIGEDITAKAGDVIVEEGSPAGGLWIISTGAFEVTLGSGDERVVVAELRQLSFFGEMSLVSENVRAAGVVCTEDGRLKKIPADRFGDLLIQNDIVAYKVVYNMCRVLAERFQRREDAWQAETADS